MAEHGKAHFNNLKLSAAGEAVRIRPWRVDLGLTHEVNFDFTTLVRIGLVATLEQPLEFLKWGSRGTK